MSEFQYVGFRAIDGPVGEKDLAFMHRQSSRAEITPWSFDNEYHFGDFRGNAEEMLRRGYDIHLHYANFGIRKLLLRIPPGMLESKVLKPYVVGDSLTYLKDKQGKGGILIVDPFYEAGDLDELWDLDALLERLVPLRAEILSGDLRPLYLAHLAVACDGYHDPDETTEAPVPAGLDALSDAQRALAELYGLANDLIAAAAVPGLPKPRRVVAAEDYASWLEQQPEARKDAWLSRLMADPHAPVRAELLAKHREADPSPAWPTTQPNRTIAQLRAAADEIARGAREKTAKLAARERAKRLVAMAANPQATLRETERLVGERSTHAYQQVGQLLAELREALSTSGRADLAEQQAKKLKAAHPRLHILTSELRRHGFLPK